MDAMDERSNVKRELEITRSGNFLNKQKAKGSRKQHKIGVVGHVNGIIFWEFLSKTVFEKFVVN